MLSFADSARIEAASRELSQRLGGNVAAAAVLGSGFSPLVDLLAETRRVPFTDVDGLPACTAPGHRGEIVAGTLGGDRYVFFQGRLHLYEGRSSAVIGIPLALARGLGADRVLLTCAAGATSDGLEPGQLVLVEDHLNLTGENPLLSVPMAERRPPFLALGDAYDPAALAMAERLASDTPGGIRRQVLASVKGPCYETPAEYRALARLGAGLVSMSCALETIVARSLGMKVLALAIVANGPARPGTGGAESDAVLDVVGRSVRSRLGFFARLLAGFLRV